MGMMACSATATCSAWSSFRDGGSRACYLFRAAGKVNPVGGCVSGGAAHPAPPPPPAWTAFMVNLADLGLPVGGGWQVREVWRNASMSVKNGTFQASAGPHDAAMYVISHAA